MTSLRGSACVSVCVCAGVLVCMSALVCIWGCVCACMCAFGCMRLTLQGVTLTRGVTEAGDPGPAPFLLPLTPTGPAAPQPHRRPASEVFLQSHVLPSPPLWSRPGTSLGAWGPPGFGVALGSGGLARPSSVTSGPSVGFPNSVPQPLTLLTLQTQPEGPLLQEVFRARGPASSLPEEPSADRVLTAARAQGAAPRHRPAKAPEQPA